MDLTGDLPGDLTGHSATQDKWATLHLCYLISNKKMLLKHIKKKISSELLKQQQIIIMSEI